MQLSVSRTVVLFVVFAALLAVVTFVLIAHSAGYTTSAPTTPLAASDGGVFAY
jgi:hypothetical protein